MQIRKIILYKATGEIRELTFELGKVNIITGESKTGKTAFEEYNELIGNSGLRKSLEKLVQSKRYNDAPSQITLDENNRFGGKKAIVYDKIKFSEQYSLPVRAGVSLNPVQEKLLLSFAFTL